jgi:hypothetical protein
LASNITELVNTSEVLEQGSAAENKFQKISGLVKLTPFKVKFTIFFTFAVVFDDYTLGICLSNKRIHVVKHRTNLSDSPLIDKM